MTHEEKRTPAFWRVVCEWTEYKGTTYMVDRGTWSCCPSKAKGFECLSDALDAIADIESFKRPDIKKLRVRPVYHRVIKKPKRHGIGWAVKQLKAGKRVRRAACQKGNYTNADHADSGGHVSYESLMANDWELAE